MTENVYEEVKKVVDSYIRSVKTLDTKLMVSVAHKDGRMFIGGRDTSKNLHDHWGEEDERFSPEKKAEYASQMRCELLGLMVEGTIAFARIRLNSYIDYHNLVKTSAGWKFVDKVSHKIEC